MMDENEPSQWDAFGPMLVVQRLAAVSQRAVFKATGEDGSVGVVFASAIEVPGAAKFFPMPEGFLAAWQWLLQEAQAPEAWPPTREGCRAIERWLDTR